MSAEPPDSKGSRTINLSFISHLFERFGDSVCLSLCYIYPMFEGHSFEFFHSIGVITIP